MYEIAAPKNTLDRINQLLTIRDQVYDTINRLLLS